MNAAVALFPEWFGPLIFGLVLVTSACSSRNAGTRARTSDVAERAADQPGGMHSSSEWPAYNGGYNATRFSPVTQINTGNVASLTEVARFKLPETTAFQVRPGADRWHDVRYDRHEYLRDRRSDRRAAMEPPLRYLRAWAWARRCAALDMPMAGCFAARRTATLSLWTPRQAR